jgi:ATP-dependent DNA helicase RecQ
VCLGELKLVDDSLIVAQKIGSCVLRLKESFGAEYTSQVLVGSRDQKILQRGHDSLSTWGILKEHDKRHVRDWVEQMVEQGFLEKSGEFSVLRVTESGRRMLRGEVAPQLLKPAESSRRGARAGSGRAASRAELDSWQGVDMKLFETLRGWRRQKAAERGVPPYVVFADVSLRDIARRRPSSPEAMLEAHGVGERKMAQYGAEVLAIVAEHCRNGASQSEADFAEPAPAPRKRKSPHGGKVRGPGGHSHPTEDESEHESADEPFRFVPDESELGEPDSDFID